MDFELDDDHQAIADLAEQILGDRSTAEHLREVEVGDGFDASTWAELAKAGPRRHRDRRSSRRWRARAGRRRARSPHAVGRHTAAVPYAQGGRSRHGAGRRRAARRPAPS